MLNNKSYPPVEAVGVPQFQDANFVDTSKEKILSLPMCPDCGSINIIYDHEQGETVCADCGLVLNDQTISDKRPIYHSETAEKEIHYAPPTVQTLHNKGLSTYFRTERDARGNMLSAKNKNTIRRLKHHQYRISNNAKARSILDACRHLQRFSDQLNLPKSTHARAALLFRKVLKQDLVKGRSISSVVAACLYIACREAGIPRTYMEISKLTGINKKDLTRCYRLIVEKLNLFLPAFSAITYISVYAEKLGIHGKVVSDAISIIKALKRHTSGKDPKGLAASALYISCRQNREWLGQESIANVAGITAVTVRNRYKSIVLILGIDLDGGDSE